MRNLWGFLSAAILSCVEAQGFEPPQTTGIRFLVTVDSENRPVSEPVGPFGAGDELPRATTIRADHRLLMLSIDEAELRARFPAYDVSKLDEVSMLRASGEISACTEDGFLEEDRRLVVPLEIIPTAASVSSFKDADPTEETWPLPAGLALRFEARVCGRGPGLRLSPVAENVDLFAHIEGTAGVGFAETVGELDEDTLLLFGARGLLRVRRGGRVDLAIDRLPLTEILEHPELGRLEWDIKFGAIAPVRAPGGAAVAVLALTLRENNEPFGFEQDAGAALAYVLVHPDGRLERGRSWVYEPAPEQTDASMRHLLFEADGSYSAVGRFVVATATSPTASPEWSHARGLDGRAVVALEEPGARHLVVGGGGFAFEGDLFMGPSAGRSYETGIDASIRFHAATRLDDAESTVIAVGLLGNVFARGPGSVWRRHRMAVPVEAAACASSGLDCGRRSAALELASVVPVPGDRGVLIGSHQCSAVYYRSPLSACARATSLDLDQEVRLRTGAVVTSLTAHRGRLYATGGEHLLYEIEVDPE